LIFKQKYVETLVDACERVKMLINAIDHGLSGLTRVNSANVLDEGLRIRGRGRWMNLTVEVIQTRRDYVCIENKRSTQLAQSQSVPSRALLAPIYRWPGLKDLVGFNTNYSVRI
jgi:hypothetical protein